jgi:hypothetical protein
MSENFMSESYIIEIRPAAPGVTVRAGLVVREDCGFRFFAATHAFHRLEGQLFRSPKAAETAALRHVTNMNNRRHQRIQPTKWQKIFGAGAPSD